MRFRGARLWLVAGSVVVVSLAAFAAAVGSARGSDQAGGWREVEGSVGPTAQSEVAIARGSKQTLYVAFTTASSSLLVVPVSPAGVPGAAVTAIAKVNVLSSPKLLPEADGVRAFWSGYSYALGGGGTYSAAAPASLSPFGSWQRVTSATLPKHTSWARPLAARELDGTPLIATDASEVVLHRGLDAGSTDNVFDADCCPQNLGIAVDGKSGAVWLAWTRLNADNALLVQQADRATGAPLGVVQKARLANGQIAHAIADQRVAVSGRIGRSGVFVAFLDQSRKQLLLWHVGTAKAIPVAKSSGFISKPVLAAGPHGEVWLAWLDSSRGAYHVLVRKLAANGRALGPVQTLAFPKTSSFLNPEQLLASARGSTIDLVLHGWTGSGRVFVTNVKG